MDKHEIERLIKMVLEVGPVSPSTLRLLLIDWKFDPLEFTPRIMYGIEMGVYELNREMFLALRKE